MRGARKMVITYIPIEDNANFYQKCGVIGSELSLLISIAELAQTLHYSGANYNPKSREIILCKDAIQSRPLDASTAQALNNIYFMLYFASQVMCGGVSEQLVSRLGDVERRLKAVEEDNQVLRGLLETTHNIPAAEPAARGVIEVSAEEIVSGADPAEVVEAVVLPAEGVQELSSAIAVVIKEPIHEKFPGDVLKGFTNFDSASHDDPDAKEIMLLRQQAITMGGMLTVKGRIGTYRRPSGLGWETSLEPERKHCGNRVEFLVPEELADMRRFFTHDQTLLLELCVATRAG